MVTCRCDRALDEMGHCPECSMRPHGCACSPATGNVIQVSVWQDRGPEDGDPGTALPTTSPSEEEEFAVIPPPTNPMAVARVFVQEHYEEDGQAILRHHGGDFRRYVGTHYEDLEDAAVRAEAYGWLEGKKYLKKMEFKSWEPDRRKLGDLLEALKAVGYVDGTQVPPLWLTDRADPPAGELVPMANGLLHVPTRALYPHTPELFALNSLPFDYDPAAGQPDAWMGFLRDLWPEDDDSIDTLAEVFGYVISASTALQKAFMIVGPRRSGKGTIGRVLTGLLGAHRVAGPTLSGLAQNFGLQDLIGKPLALISDARLSTRSDSSIAVERLLSISGEDVLTVDRKYRDPWTGRIPARFLVLTNELPRFHDSSGALASRFIILVTENSFYGREDPALTDKLLEEAPAILNWSLAGLDRLRARGHFVPPRSSVDAARQMEDLASPVGAFVRERCVLESDAITPKDLVWEAWKDWAESSGVGRGSKATLMRDLYAAHPRIRQERPREGEDRVQVVRGIRLKLAQQSDEPLTALTNPSVPRSGQGGQGSDPLSAELKEWPA